MCRTYWYGRLWMLVRTLYGIGQSFSSDHGRTWSLGEDSLLGGPNSRFFIRRLASGRLLLVNHADISAAAAAALCREGKTWRPRRKLTACLSEDDGKTWQGFKQIPFGSVQRVTFDPNDPKHIYLSTFGASIIKAPIEP